MAQQKITFNEVSTNTAIATSQLDSASANGTGAILVPSGTTAQRPAATTSGYIRFNTTLNSLESANGSAWANVGSGSASSGGGGITWSSDVQNTSFIAIKNTGYFINTATNAVTVTLPSTPSLGDIVTLTDYAGYFGANNLIIYPNGNKIQGNTANAIISKNGFSVQLAYADSNRGWIGYSGLPSAIIGPYSIDYLIVAGGGAGGGGTYHGAGGGAGGLITGTNISVTPGTSYTVTVGGGGSGLTNGTGPSGSNSSLTGISPALGGGGGGSYTAVSSAGGSGGGGGGGGGPGGQSASAGTSGQGNPGGNGFNGGPNYGAGGGGGAGSTGGAGGPPNGGNGGSGSSSSLSGTAVNYAGGGGGSTYGGGTPGTGGAGGGGDGSQSGATSGGTNTGGGGGGAERNGTALSGSGGSGIVIIRYSGNQQKASGGTISITGGYVVHTFNSSGTFTA